MTVNFITGERYVTWYNWSEHLSKYFRTFPAISVLHHFRLDASELGTVFAKEYDHSEETRYKILRDDEVLETIHALPPEITAPGMSIDRKKIISGNFAQQKKLLTLPVLNQLEVRVLLPSARRERMHLLLLTLPVLYQLEVRVLLPSAKRETIQLYR